MRNQFIFAIIFIVFISCALGLGIVPGKTSVDFAPTLEKSYQVQIMNSEHKDMKLSISVSGKLKDYIKVSDESLTMLASEESKTISYTVKLPAYLEPGTHLSDIIILQLPESSDDSGAVVGTAIAVLSQVQVNVPYPGKYLISQFNINGKAQGEDTTFIFPIKSLGEADIVSVYANIDIYNKLNEKVASVNTDETSLLSKAEGEIVSTWKADVPNGAYLAKATLVYDDTSISLEKEFNIGTLDLVLEEIKVRDFSLGEIAKLEMLVENKWSEDILDVYTLTKIYGQDGRTLSEFKSPTYNIPALQKTVMTSYWYSTGFKEGTYDASVYLNYGQKSTQKDLQMKVSQNSVEIIGLGYVISEKSNKKSSSGVITILVVVVVVLILINVLWFMMLRKKLFGKH